jgi:predicted DNA-binding transcriptional regulator YafY
MSSRKTERQLDLLFILLNASRPLTRESLRIKIEDYREQASAEAFERMFERDKEDLREIGVPIETRKLSSLFDDEFGYLVSIKDFGVKETLFTSDEINELTRAALVWKDSLLSSGARLGLVKTATQVGKLIDINQDFEISEIIADHIYIQITEAVTHGLIIEFNYTKPHDKAPSLRRVYPTNLTTAGPFVHLYAYDFKDDTNKIFNISRISGEVSTQEPSENEVTLIKRQNSFNPVEEVSNTAVITPLVNADVLRHSLGGREINGNIEIDFFNEESFSVFLAPFASDIKSIKPDSLSTLVIAQLQTLKEKLV